MITWRLWRALNRPTGLTAVYYHLFLRRGFVESTPYEIPALNLLAALLFALLPAAFIFFGVPFVFTAFTSLLPHTAAAIPLVVTAYGLALCITVSGQIAHEHDVGIYETLGATSPGALGLHWAYTVRWIARQRLLRWLLLGVVAVGTFSALLGLVSSQITPVPPVLANDSSLTIARLVTTAAVIGQLWLDYIQTIVLSSLIAMLVPAYARQESNARLGAAAALVSLQLGLFLISSLAALSLALAASALPDRQMVYALAALVMRFAFREGAIHLIWRQLVRTLNAKPSELDTLVNAGL